MTMRLSLCTLLAVTFALLQSNVTRAETGTPYAPIARIDQYSLDDLINTPFIQSFDLSPDGKYISVLVTSDSQIEGSLWLITEEVVSKRVIAKRHLSDKTNTIVNFPPQVLYSSDQRYLIVQDSTKIEVLNSGNLESLRTIVGTSGQPGLLPLYVLGASNSDVFVCAFAPQPKSNYVFHTTPVQLDVVDVSTGRQLGEWKSEDIPQSISPKGDLIAVSSSQEERGVLPLSVHDVHGHEVAKLTGGFFFKELAGRSKPLGRVKGQFVGDQEIILSPDENVDRTGHHSGNNLQIMSIDGNQVKVLQTVRPHDYGPKGAIFSSANHRTVLVASEYVSAWDLRHEWSLPATAPEFLIYGKDTKGMHLEATLPARQLGKMASGWEAVWRLRASSDGSTIAVAEDSGITVLTRKP